MALIGAVESTIGTRAGTYMLASALRFSRLGRLADLAHHYRQGSHSSHH